MTCSYTGIHYNYYVQVKLLDTVAQMESGISLMS